MVDTWQPNRKNSEISVQKLSTFAGIITNIDRAKDDLSTLHNEDIAYIETLINTPSSAWIKAIEGLSIEQVKNLCVFFTVGEMVFPNWNFSSNNPTIFFIKHLKSSNNALEKDFIRWLKKQTDNRYIPYGAAL